MKRTFKLLLLTGIIIILLIPIFGSARGKNEEINILENVLEELGGEFLEGDLNMGATIVEEFLGEEDIRSIGEDVSLKMDLIEMEKEFIKEENFNQLNIYAYNEEENPITIMISSYSDPYTNIAETTLFINLIKRGKNFDINGIIEKIETIFNEFNKPIDITTCIIGTIEGRIEYNRLESKMLKAMDKLKIKVVEEYTDESIISYTGYTSLIDNSIFSGKEKVNLNLAIRYNENENKNYIWIGTPIITTGY